MAEPTIVLITGASRGLGKALVESYLTRPNHVVIGTTRSLTSPGLSSLHTIAPAQNTTLHILELEATKDSDYTSLLTSLASAGITHLDIVIANSAVAFPLGSPAKVPMSAVKEVLDVNTLGPLRLFQSTRALLEGAKNKGRNPKWVTITSAGGTIGGCEEFDPGYGLTAMTPYCLSKTSLNWVTVAIHTSEKWLVALCLHPGFAQTEMGNAYAVRLGLAEAPFTIEESISKTMAAIDQGTRETTSGKFWSVLDGVELPW